MEIILTDVIIFLMNIAMKNIPLKYINIIINDENYITFVKNMKKNSTRKIIEKYEREGE